MHSANVGTSLKALDENMPNMTCKKNWRVVHMIMNSEL